MEELEFSRHGEPRRPPACAWRRCCRRPPRAPTSSRPRSSGSRMARPARDPLLYGVGHRPLVSKRVWDRGRGQDDAYWVLEPASLCVCVCVPLQGGEWGGSIVLEERGGGATPTASCAARQPGLRSAPPWRLCRPRTHVVRGWAPLL